MKAFKDRAGRTWNVDINVVTAKRLLSLAGLDITKLHEPQVFMPLADNPVKMVDALYVAVKPQADAAGITDEEFGVSMGGSAIDDGFTAFMEEVADFFRLPEQRETFRLALNRVRQIGAKAGVLALEKLNDPNLDAEILAAMSGEPSTK